MEIYNAMKSQPCVDCGGKFPPECMDFDHIHGEKVHLVSRIRNGNMQILMEEIEKCDLICANCHRRRTQKRRLEK